MTGYTGAGVHFREFRADTRSVLHHLATLRAFKPHRSSAKYRLMYIKIQTDVHKSWAVQFDLAVDRRYAVDPAECEMCKGTRSLGAAGKYCARCALSRT
jgi:hypothetical protein